MSRIEAEARESLLRRRRSLAEAGSAGASTLRLTGGAGGEPLTEGARRELAEIDAALARIQEGRYGSCLACGGAMGLQRLRAIPEARYCVACSGQAAVAE